MTGRSDLGSALEQYFASLPFAPDPFQIEAAGAIAAGDSVVVTAPTGAGKTVVAEAAVARAVAGGTRAFYTTPIKALSNQKFGDLVAAYGAGTVGLLTGDNVINGGAPIVVMTTEVLRNMIYSDSAALDSLGVVILDEVHYLQDRYRGAVWEEIIIHLPRRVPLVCLSATIANAEEFTAWVEARRGPTRLVVEKTRPVPLESLFMVKDRHREGGIITLPVFGRGGERANPEVTKLLRKGRGRFRRFATPRRLEVVDEVHRLGLLPAIYFIFSRAGCDQAADAVAAARMGFTDAGDRTMIRRVAEERTAHLHPIDLEVLGYSGWLANLEQGVAAHHAGLVPAFKEVTEELFAAGLLRVVFATETLALGINMPARTVVLEQLSKFDGEAHVRLQPGDYTQLTGRAGRRGIDTRGTAIVLHSAYIGFDEVVATAAAGSHPLVSSFQPTYNMAVNLVANYERDVAEELLNASFAQFREDGRRLQLAARVEQRRADLEEFRGAAECDRGDIWEYVAASAAAGDATTLIGDFLQRTREGDVLQLTGDPDDRWVIVARGYGAQPRLLLVDAAGGARRVSPKDLTPALTRAGHVDLPQPVLSRDNGYRRAVGRLLRGFEPEGSEGVGGVDAIEHPVASCHDLAKHIDWARRARRAERDLQRLERRIAVASGGLVAAFDATLALLESWGYTTGWGLTDKGERLRFVYNELDLVLTESIERGYLDGLTGPDLAAAASMFTFEPRATSPEARRPNGLVAERGELITGLAAAINAAERAGGVPETRYPDHGFAAVAHDWTAGATLEDLFEDDEGSAGDFVRNARQLLDLLRQVRDTFPRLADQARLAIKAIDRGVVAAGGRI
ncbi:MAG TPA: DEAD/DEAH box helicase [Acidimicrobiia bacterium]